MLRQITRPEWAIMKKAGRPATAVAGILPAAYFPCGILNFSYFVRCVCFVVSISGFGLRSDGLLVQWAAEMRGETPTLLEASFHLRACASFKALYCFNTPSNGKIFLFQSETRRICGKSW